jgi:cell division protein FtsL
MPDVQRYTCRKYTYVYKMMMMMMITITIIMKVIKISSEDTLYSQPIKSQNKNKKPQNNECLLFEVSVLWG